MNPVAKALWFIESHFTGEVTLAAIPRSPACLVSYGSRVGMTTGYPVMRYVRGRRLTEAAAHLPAARRIS